MRFKKRIAIILLGRSGAGKGTQADFIKRHIGDGLYTLETGKMVRAFLGQTGTSARIGRKTVTGGRLLPDWFADFLWLRDFFEKDLADRHILFDGSPRSVRQAEFCDEVMAWHSRPLPVCIYLTVSKRAAIARLLKRGRFDDTPRAIRNRMNFFDKSVSRVIMYYKRQGRLITIDGEPEPRLVEISLGKALRTHIARMRA